MQIIVKPDRTQSRVLFSGYQRVHLENGDWCLSPLLGFIVPNEAVMGMRKLIGSVNTIFAGYNVKGYTVSAGIADCYAYASVSPSNTEVAKHIISKTEIDHGR